MLRSALVLSLSLSLLAAPLAAACPTNKVFEAPYRTSFVDVAVVGTKLWAATSYGVELLDRTTTPPRRIASMPLPGPSTVVRTRGDVAYVGSGTSVYAIKYVGDALVQTGSVDVGGLVRDMAVNGSFLYVAATNGVTQVDLFNIEKPVVASKLTATTTGSATAVLPFDLYLYVADGDSTVDVYSLSVASLPQKVGTFAALPQTISVRATPNRIYASDGQQTQVFIPNGPTSQRVASASVGVIPLTPLVANVAWVAGNDRRVRAVDFSSSSPSIVFQYTVPASRGSLNRVSGLATAQNVLYVAAGDAGLVQIDTSKITVPFALHGNATDPSTSLGAVTGGIVITPEAGGFTAFATTSGFPLSPRSWDSGSWNVRDAVGSRVLASKGTTLQLFDIATTPPSASAGNTLRANVRAAVLVGGAAYVVLEDKSLFRVDAQVGGTPTQISGVTPSAIGRNGSAVAVTELNADGTTTIRYWSDGDLTKPAQTKSVEGAATSGVAVGSNDRVAVATFKGISVIDFKSSSVALVAGTPPGVGLQFAGDKLLFASGSSLWTYDATALTAAPIVTELPSTALSFARGDVTDTAWVLTTDGVASIRIASLAAITSTTLDPANRYFKSLEVDGDLLYLIEGERVDQFLLDGASRPSFASSFSLDASTLDIAAGGGSLFAITSAGDVVKYTASGLEQARVRINESADQSLLSVEYIAGAVHVSLLRGCSSGLCEKKTLVYDPRTGLTPTSSYSGSVVDYAVNGSSAVLLLDLPKELRRVSLADPYRPQTTASVTLTGNPISVAWAPSIQTVYVLGDRLTAYDEQSLTKTGDQLSPWSADLTGRVTYLDQQLRISGDCGVIVGRSFNAQRFTPVAASGTPVVQNIELPAASKRVVTNANATFVLTDYSLQIYSSAPLPKRKRPVL